jgi:hypothetical protein
MIIEHKKYTVELEKIYLTSRKKVLKLFKNKTVLKLTGADTIKGNFDTGKDFLLTFNDRGKITGHIIYLLKDHICLSWNVEGFNLPDEYSTVNIFLDKKGEKCILTLIHEGIKNKRSAELKDKAWTEILEDLEKELKRI